MSMPARRTTHLRWGRVSVPHATYFVTACTRHRQRIFEQSAISARATETLREIHLAQDATILAAVVMPDHVHLLLSLGTRLRLGQVIGKFKSLTIQGESTWHWQQDGFEQRLRPRDAIEDFGFYIFMNPYRAGLLAPTESWPGWYCPDSSRFSFLGQVAKERAVPAEWIEKSVGIGRRLALRT